MCKITFSIDPDEMDALVAQQLRASYIDMADQRFKWAERVPTMEAILVVLQHFMPVHEFEAWYETIKEL